MTRPDSYGFNNDRSLHDFTSDFDSIGDQIADINEALDGKANSWHTHTPSQLTGPGTISKTLLPALAAEDIPNISGAKITSGTINKNRLPNDIPASKIAGTLAVSNIPAITTDKISDIGWSTFGPNYNPDDPGRMIPNRAEASGPYGSADNSGWNYIRIGGEIVIAYGVLHAKLVIDTAHGSIYRTDTRYLRMPKGPVSGNLGFSSIFYVGFGSLGGNPVSGVSAIMAGQRSDWAKLNGYVASIPFRYTSPVAVTVASDVYVPVLVIGDMH